jgi:hypothetical protein
MNEVWVFNGEGGTFPAGVFASKEGAEAWIKANKLSGCLTKYPVGVSVYDWAIAEGHWAPKQEHHPNPAQHRTKMCPLAATTWWHDFKDFSKPDDRFAGDVNHGCPRKHMWCFASTPSTYNRLSVDSVAPIGGGADSRILEIIFGGLADVPNV